jgi:DNA-binding transcriptional MerR regulator
MYRIAEFARLHDIPIKTLRFYDEIGLLRPARVDRAAGYRFYAAADSERLNRILVFKDLGFSLREVGVLLADNIPPEQLRAMIHAKHELLRRDAEESLARLARASARLDRMQGGAPPLVAVRETGPRLVASMRERISSHDESELLLSELSRRLGRDRPRGCRGAIWHHCEAGAIECEVFEFLDSTPLAADGVRFSELPRQRFASLIYRGDADYLPAFKAVRDWMAASGVEPSGPKRELYLDEGDGNRQSVTEIQFPIFPARRSLQ